ncbi:MAG TPA: HAD family hydrolase, partial [Thermomicrobiales bacterium]|nr:HAD family hydrolase [Thermomicrobiales bacterium]
IACDSWFELETRTLPVQVVARLANHGISLLVHPENQVLEQTYRWLRQEIMAHGNELDAVAGMMETLRRLNLHIAEYAVTEVVDELFRELVPESSPLAGVLPLIQALAGRDIPLGVVSSAVHHEFLEWCLARHGLGESISVVISSARAGFYKSNPEIYRIALAQLGADARESIHVGDSFRFDHQSSSAIGMGTVWLNQERIGPPADAVGLPDLELASYDAALQAILDLFTSRKQVSIAH